MPVEKEPVTVRIPVVVLDIIQEIARERCKDRSDVIRDLLSTHPEIQPRLRQKMKTLTKEVQ